MRDVDLSVVTYRPDLALLASLFASLAEAAGSLRLHLLMQDNSP